MNDAVKAHTSDIIKTVLSAAVGGALVLATTAKEVEPGYVEILQEEIGNLRSELAAEQAGNLSLSLQLADLQRELGSGVDVVESAAVFSFVTRIKRPAWCKRVVEEVDPKTGNSTVRFQMAFLNDSYEDRYKVTAARYTGQTDFDIWPVRLASEYYENDVFAWKSRDYHENTESTITGDTVFAKWWVKIPSGIEYICGLQVKP